jgi:tetratricopeptide (TPR) repeat protein
MLYNAGEVMAPTKKIETLFLSGQFMDVCEVLEDEAHAKQAQTHFPLWIGSLVFTGNLDKALALYDEKNLPKEHIIACRFYLSLGYIRKSQYQKARSVLAKNLNEISATNSDWDLFYIYQGIAFYRYFSGRYFVAKKYAQKAFSFSVKSRFVFGEMISKDLLAHCLVQIGQNREGLKLFEQALDMADKNKNEWLRAAIRISLLKFRAQFGMKPQEDLENLKKALAKLTPQDTYSIAELQLEMIRQYILRGQFTNAEQCFAVASEMIYKHQNRRQIATLNLRMSYMLYLQGQYMQALHIIRFAEQNIDNHIDLNLWTQMSGLKKMILLETKTNENISAIDKELIEKLSQTQMAIHKKIIFRNLKKQRPFPAGEDPIGDLLDKIAVGDTLAPRMLVEKGYYGLLHKCYHLPFGAQALIFDLMPGTLVILDKGNVTFKKKSLNSILRKIIFLLKDSPQTKEELVEKIWGYNYDPIRHDPLIYSSMNKIRRFLENYSDWLELSENGYRMRSGTKIIIKNNLKVENVESLVSQGAQTFHLPSAAGTLNASTDLQNLNYRQIQVLEYLKKNSSISIFELSSKLEVSKPTATRDLSQLHKLGRLRRVGKGRATRYLI